MLESRKNLPFLPEATNREVAELLDANQLNRDPLPEFLVGSIGKINGTHSAMTYLALELVGADSASDSDGIGSFGLRLSEICQGARRYDGLFQEIRAIVVGE